MGIFSEHGIYYFYEDKTTLRYKIKAVYLTLLTYFVLVPIAAVIVSAVLLATLLFLLSIRFKEFLGFKTKDRYYAD